MDIVTGVVFEPIVKLDIDIKSLQNKDFDKLHILGWSEEGVAYDFIKHMILRDPVERQIIDDLYKQGRLVYHCNIIHPRHNDASFHVPWPEFDQFLGWQKYKEIAHKPTQLYHCQTLTYRPHKDMLVESLLQNNLDGEIYYKRVQDIWDKIPNTPTWHKQVDRFVESNNYDPDFVFDGDTNPPPPVDVWKRSLFLITPESTDEIVLHTEKTWMPILWKMPSILVGAKNLNTKLEEKGYRLFHNVIDYEFDRLNTMQQRIDALIEQLQNIKDYQVAAQKMHNDLEYNHRLFLNEIAYGFKPQVLTATAQYTPEAQKVKDMILKATRQAKQLTNGENIV
jgi:hypothetical protein